MQVPATIESFQFGDTAVQAFVPSYDWIQAQYQRSKAAGENPGFPYWAKVWPAARALCELIAKQPDLVLNKKVLELAAGIGLPSLLAARFAEKVTTSDYFTDAVEIIQASIHLNKINNMQAVVMDWNDLDHHVAADILLLSDINYDPASFAVLYKLLMGFLEQGTTLLLSTPQRLSGRAFMEQLEPWCRYQEEIRVTTGITPVYTTVWILQR